jgi:hypothetical protein
MREHGIDGPLIRQSNFESQNPLPAEITCYRHIEVIFAFEYSAAEKDFSIVLDGNSKTEFNATEVSRYYSTSPESRVEYPIAGIARERKILFRVIAGFTANHQLPVALERD